MKIHEYQAKEIFAKHGIPIDKGVMVESAEQVPQAIKQLEGAKEFVVKAQVHAGGRGKGGGIKFAKSPEECLEVTKKILGMKLVTPQTGAAGKIVRKVWIQKPADIDKEYYLAVTLDRSKAKGVIIYSQAGGMDIEEVARTQPEKIFKKYFDVVFGLSPFEAREIAYNLGKGPDFVKGVTHTVQKIANIFLNLDATLVEINPLAANKEGKVDAVDAKIDFDDNALFRHTDIAAMRDPLEEDPREAEAKKYGLSYVGLDGNVGCMVNGAGLAMATMDVIKLAGGMPANFLDVGGGAKVDQVKAAFKIILQDPHVKAILVNIFGGIMKCDVVAEGVIQAAKEVQVKVPIVVRLEGTNVEQGRALLKSSGLSIVSAEGLSEAAKKVVELAGKS